MMNISKLRERMEREGLDALIAASPENFYYSTGHPSFLLYTARIAGAALAVIPRSENIEPVVVISEFEVANFQTKSDIKEIVTYPMWIHIEDLREVSSPKEMAHLEPPPAKAETVDLYGNFEKLASAVRKMGLEKSVIGVEYFFFQQMSWSMLTSLLPEAEFADAMSLFYECRSVKSAKEIDYLREAARFAEAGLEASAREIRAGVTEKELASAYRTAVAAEHCSRGARHCIISIGERFSPSYLPREHLAGAGDLVKYDVGADCGGYGSDMGRTFVVGKPGALQESIHAALLAGHDAALGAMGPGVKMSDVFQVGQETVRANGIPSYTRGHIGHSVGLDEKIEEPPNFSAHEDRLLEPGMVLCVEMPYYAYGVGAFQIEDMVLVTEGGCEKLTELSRELIRVDG
ncbi:MAG: M24 family metallopeptidase [Candidatus Abyssubacteria bacterium]|nr:M24 family metallopeptidase [Candidatus Abyssubacteria bacterium]